MKRLIWTAWSGYAQLYIASAVLVVILGCMVKLTNEFEFPIASFHHASEAWLVPNLLKRT